MCAPRCKIQRHYHRAYIILIFLSASRIETAAGDGEAILVRGHSHFLSCLLTDLLLILILLLVNKTSARSGREVLITATGY